MLEARAAAHEERLPPGTPTRQTPSTRTPERFYEGEQAQSAARAGAAPKRAIDQELERGGGADGRAAGGCCGGHPGVLGDATFVLRDSTQSSSMLRCPGASEGGVPERFSVLSREQRAVHRNGQVRTDLRGWSPGVGFEPRAASSRETAPVAPCGAPGRSSATPYPSTPRPRLTAQGEVGTPDRIRTCDLLLRRQTLYPAELRARPGRAVCVLRDQLSKPGRGLAGSRKPARGPGKSSSSSAAHFPGEAT